MKTAVDTVQDNQKLSIALQTFEQTFKNSPTDVMAFCKLGRFFWEAGREKEYEECLRHCVELLKMAMRNNAMEAVLQIEHLIINSLVSTVESEEHYHRCISLWRDDMAAFGSNYRSIDATSVQVDLTRIGFVVHTGVVLAHTEVMFRHLESLRISNPLGIVPRIYVIGHYTQDFLNRAQALNVDVITTNPTAAMFGARVLALRDKLKADKVGIMVWVCTPVNAIFTFSARIAPVQIYWSMKFHAVYGPFIDGYLTGGGGAEVSEKERMFNGQAWQVCPVPLAMDYPAPSQEAIAQFRAPYGDAFILGVLAREEKINHLDYLEVVADILLENPNCVFLWTGRTQPLQVVEYFKSKGVANRCHFIGWVDTTLVSACLDLFLETFPYGVGVIPFQVMKAGTPLLSFVDKRTTFGIEFWQAYQDGWDLAKSPVLAARNKEEYVRLASELIRNPTFRQKVAAAGHSYFEQRIADTKKYATRFFSIIQDIARHKSGQAGNAA